LSLVVKQYVKRGLLGFDGVLDEIFNVMKGLYNNDFMKFDGFLP
jgi:hypothetical protein